MRFTLYTYIIFIEIYYIVILKSFKIDKIYSNYTNKLLLFLIIIYQYTIYLLSFYHTQSKYCNLDIFLAPSELRQNFQKISVKEYIIKLYSNNLILNLLILFLKQCII